MPASSLRFIPTLTGIALGAAATLGGCATTDFDRKAAGSSHLNHVVLISLADPMDAEACAADCRTMLSGIDAVETIWVGTPVDTGRDAVDGDYEVGLCVGFETMDGLQEYLQDPRHLELVALWKPRATGFRIFDVGSPELRR